eukprot:TRINITY_DN3983_c0_g2_i6.p1 TRINITY_DN3983_c0_g2~~TRINITY_DN3983_c0_g2_i6.p1  ORF type:complete len:349 (+),score=58.40 TRINITY_DN3983_c0_g2_i6:1607-2653(+)
MVTIKDVARMTGLSVSTVSAVLGNRAGQLGIKEETCGKVRSAAAELGYRRNAIASQMQSGRSNIMVFTVPYLGSEYMFPAAIRAGQAAEANGYLLKLFTPSKGGQEYVSQIDKILEYRPAAILHWGDPGCAMDYLMKVSRECGIPVVFIDFANEHTLMSVTTDDISGISQAVEHLAGLGHRRIAHVTDSLAAEYAVQRLKAFRRSMGDAGLPVSEDIIFHGIYFQDTERLDEFIDRIMSSDVAPTAFCCGSDFIALSLLTRLQRRGIMVPEDVSLIGYADLNFSVYCSPKLSTIRQPLADMGSAAVECAIKAMNNSDMRAQLQLPTELVVRDSTSPCIVSTITPCTLR